MADLYVKITVLGFGSGADPANWTISLEHTGGLTDEFLVALLKATIHSVENLAPYSDDVFSEFEADMREPDETDTAFD